jgi:hypothetical protein
MGKCPSPTLWWILPQFSLCWMPSPLQAHWGRWCHTHLLWMACLFTVYVGKCPYPPLWWSFPPTSTVTSFSHSKVAGWVLQLLSSPVILFIYSSHEGVPSPTLQSSGHPALFAVCLFFFNCLFIIQFGFFLSPGRGQSVQGAMLICPRVVCGSTMCHLFAHLMVCVSQAG